MSALHSFAKTQPLRNNTTQLVLSLGQPVSFKTLMLLSSYRTLVSICGLGLITWMMTSCQPSLSVYWLPDRGIREMYIGNRRPPKKRVTYTDRSLANVLAQLGGTGGMKYVHFLDGIDPWQKGVLGSGTTDTEMSLNRVLEEVVVATPFHIYTTGDTLVVAYANAD